MADSDVLKRLLMMTAPDATQAAPLPHEMFMTQPQGFALPAPQFSVQSSPHERMTHPRFRGGIDVPALGGAIGISGEYQPKQYGPAPDWSAILRYRQQF